jgi:predicted AAA+ superfamily ATPase
MRIVMKYKRRQFRVLNTRLKEKRRFIQVLAGPRQTGKTALAQQAAAASDLPVRFISADDPASHGRVWLQQQWGAARAEARDAGKEGSVLIIDEVQKIPDWSESVKRLWDEDTASRIPLKVLILGSAPLLLQRGLTESLAGRFEVIRLTHWSYAEMRDAFDWSLDQYIYFGGYPGAAGLVDDEDRWKRYILDAMVETTLSRDILQLQRIDKPALLRQLFNVGSSYSGQILSYTKIVGQLQEAGNTTTLAHYLNLLGAAGMMVGLHKYAGQRVRQRASSPKFQALNTALITCQSELTFDQAKDDRSYWGRLVESAVGAHLVNESHDEGASIYYWREGHREVDFVMKKGKILAALEVKSGAEDEGLSGMEEFAKKFKTRRLLLVGPDGIPLERFLGSPIAEWVE